MTADDARARERLAAALHDLVMDNPMWIGNDGQPLDYLPEREALIGDFLDAAARVLLPEVVAFAEERAAEELRAAADDWSDKGKSGEYDDDESADFLRNRADALGQARRQT